MKVYIFFKNDEDRDDNYHSVITVMNNPNLEEFRKQFPDENDFYVEEHDMEEVEKTNTDGFRSFDIIFEPDKKSSFAKYPKHSKYNPKNLKIEIIRTIGKKCIYQSPRIFSQYLNHIDHWGVHVFAIDEEHAKQIATEIMSKFLEENHEN